MTRRTVGSPEWQLGTEICSVGEWGVKTLPPGTPITLDAEHTLNILPETLTPSDNCSQRSLATVHLQNC
jgi:hypothetical protein